MKKFFYIISIALVFTISLLTIINLKQNKTSKTDKITIVTTLFPLYDFAKNIGGDKVAVSLLLPPGTEAHNFDPKPSDIVRINQASLLIYTGKFMEPWVKDITNSLTNQKIKILDTSMNITMIPAVFHDTDEPEGTADPHIWLDFDNTKTMVDNIVNALVQIDPVNANYYQQNALAYKNKLSVLDNDYQTALSNCVSKEIVYGGHYALGYLANRYQLKYLAAQGISPDAEPTMSDLIKLITQIKQDKIKYIFYEELSSPKIAETLANETDTKMLPLRAAHNVAKEDLVNQVSFLTIMNENLVNLKIGLECK